jgi:hypothetical protein
VTKEQASLSARVDVVSVIAGDAQLIIEDTGRKLVVAKTNGETRARSKTISIWILL